MCASYFSNVGNAIKSEIRRSVRIGKPIIMSIQRRFATIPTALSHPRHLVWLDFAYLGKSSVFVTVDEKHSHRVCKKNKWRGWGSHGVGEVLGTWQIIDDPSLRFPLAATRLEKKSSPVKSVEIDIHRRTAVLGLPSHRPLYHISFVCQQTYLPSRHQWISYSNFQFFLNAMKTSSLSPTRKMLANFGIHWSSAWVLKGVIPASQTWTDLPMGEINWSNV